LSGWLWAHLLLVAVYIELNMGQQTSRLQNSVTQLQYQQTNDLADEFQQIIASLQRLQQENADMKYQLIESVNSLKELKKDVSNLRNFLDHQLLPAENLTRTGIEQLNQEHTQIKSGM
jgi:septal ring factor EnvC (AmiA/AmiB activator)